MRRGLIAMLPLLNILAGRILFIAVFTIFTSNANARDPLSIPTCAPDVRLIKCYTASTGLAVIHCELETKSAVGEYDLGKGSATDMLAKIGSCTKRHREQIDPRYDAAAKYLAGNSVGLNLLKDYHAFWLGTMDSLDQDSNETKGAYERRMAERKAALRDKGNRLLLEK